MWPAKHIKCNSDDEPFEWRVHWQFGTHTFSVNTMDFEAKEVRDATSTPFTDDEDGGDGFARVISRMSTVRRPSPPTSIFKVPLAVCPKPIEETTAANTSYPSRTQSRAHDPARSTMTSASVNVLRPLSINKRHARTNTNSTYKSAVVQRSASIMDRGRPVRKESRGICWPGVGHELSTKAAEGWKREKGRDGRFSVADLGYYR